MAAQRTTILDLPNEILSEIYAYLAWSPEDSIRPSSPDLVNISLTCQQLRFATLPLLFRDVRLKLRWVDGTIAAPGLYRLRQERPDLVRFVRCVHIQAEFQQSLGRAGSRSKPLQMPKSLREWMPVPRDGTDQNMLRDDLISRHTERIQYIARDMLSEQSESFIPGNSIARAKAYDAHAKRTLLEIANGSQTVEESHGEQEHDAAVAQNKSSAENGETAEIGPSHDDGRDHATRNREMILRRFQLDALVLCIMALPPQMHTLIFEALQPDRLDKFQFFFAQQVCAMACKVFRNGLRDVTMYSSKLRGEVQMGPMPSGLLALRDNHLAMAALPEVHALEKLTIVPASEDASRNLFSRMSTSWQTPELCARIMHLCIRDASDNLTSLLDFINTFPALTDLSLRDVQLIPDGNAALGPRVQLFDDAPWLHFVLTLRRQMPDVRFHLAGLSQRPWRTGLRAISRSAVRWLVKEAVPVGAVLDLEREERLLEDYEKFSQLLWEVEDGERGPLARRDKGWAKLVDEAMTSRWREYM